MPATQEQKKKYAVLAFEENEKGYRRYIRLITDGVPEDEVRANVKESFKWGDRRLDRVLETRAGVFSPKTASELEAKALVYIQRLDNAIGALCRHCDGQLDRLDDLDDMDDSGEPNWISIELIEESSSKDFKVRKKKMTVADARRAMLEAKLSYNQRFGDALKAFKVDTIININRGVDISSMSAEDLEIHRQNLVKAREGRIVDAEYTVEQ